MVSNEALLKDENGDVILQPLVDFGVAPVAGVSVLVALDLVNSPEELETGQRRRVQLVMPPQVALELAETLTKVAKGLLEPPPSGTVRN